MYRRLIYPLLLSLMVIMALATLLFMSPLPPPSPQTFEYSLTVTLTNNGSRPMPLPPILEITVFPNTTRQRARLSSLTWSLDEYLSSSYELQRTEEGNIKLVLTNAPLELSSGSTFTLRLTMRIEQLPRQPRPLQLSPTVSPPPSSIPEELRRSFCIDTPLWNFKDPLVKSLMPNFSKASNSTLLLVSSFLNWIDTNIAYPMGQREGLVRYPNDTIASLEGDCDDRANLFITLCRAFDVPCYLQYGVVYEPGFTCNFSSPNGRYRYVAVGLGRHGWAVAYIPPWGWLPVDFTLFEGMKLREGPRGVFIESPSPLCHIEGAAIRMYNVLVEGNVTSRDYMSFNARVLEMLMKHDAYLTCEESLRSLEQARG